MGYIIIEEEGKEPETLGDKDKAKQFIDQRRGNGYRDDTGKWVSSKEIEESDKYGE